MPNPDPDEVTGLILAGGRGSRLGGVDKGLLPLAGQPLVARIAERLRPQVDRLMVNANRSLDAYRALGFDVRADPAPEGVGAFAGPLAGMLAGLEAIDRGWLACVPCDSPFLPADYVGRMLAAARAAEAAVAMAACEGRQPVFALLRAGLGTDLRRSLQAGERKIDRWFARHGMVEVDFSDRPEAFVNLNSPEDWAALTAASSDRR